MTDEIIQCPACSHRLRVPPELLGQAVECPQCGARFTAPVRTDLPMPVRPARPADAEDFGPAYADDHEARAYRGGAALTAPAVCLLIVAFLGLLANGYLTITGIAARSNPGMFEQEMQAELDRNPRLTPQQRAHLEKLLTAETVGGGLLTLGGLSLAAALLTVLGAIAMLARKAYWLALLGALAALNPVNCCCLDVNVPIAVWALVVLASADGRSAFR